VATQQEIPIVEDLSFVYPTVWPWGWILAGTAAGLILIAAVVVLGSRRRKRRAVIDTMTRPHRHALKELERAFRDWRAAGYLAFMFQVTRIIRVYLRDRFGVNAPTHTTREIIRSVENVPALSKEKQDELRRVFQQCDLIKFAALPTAASEVERLYEAACEFVRTTGWRK